jgi:predicted RNA-binding protein
MLKHYIPEVTGIYEVPQEDEQDQKLEFKPNTYA